MDNSLQLNLLPVCANSGLSPSRVSMATVVRRATASGGGVRILSTVCRRPTASRLRMNGSNVKAKTNITNSSPLLSQANSLAWRQLGQYYGHEGQTLSMVSHKLSPLSICSLAAIHFVLRQSVEKQIKINTCIVM